MNTKDMINELRHEAEIHKNDKLFTGETNISLMCSEVADKLENLDLKLEKMEQIINNSISIDRVKQAKKEMENLDYLINDAKYSDNETRIHNVDILVDAFFEIMNKLIEGK